MVYINDIAYYLPERTVSNKELKAHNPDWDMDAITKRTGVNQRRIAEKNETALDLAYKACQSLFNNNRLREEIDCIIFCTQSPDYIMPPNSCLLHKLLDLPEDVLAFDFTLACSGFIYGITLAQGLLCSKSVKNVLLVNADTYSKYINRKDRSTSVLFGDGAAVTVLNQNPGLGGRLIDIICSTSGKNYEKFIIPAGGSRYPKTKKTQIEEIDKSGNVRAKDQIYMDGMGILGFVTSKVPMQIKNIMARNNLKNNDIDLFIFHQASKLALDSLGKVMKIPSDKIYTNLKIIGNTVSASIPIALIDAINDNKVKKGDKILLSGFGVGLSWGTAIVQY